VYYKIIKRGFDVFISVAMILTLLPLFLFCWVLIKIKLGSPVIFKQIRPGYKGKPFPLYKFRSMLDHRDEKGNPLPDNARLTAFGKRLRSTSIDELPELLNVVKGEMSIVGPRPLLMSYLPLYNARQARRHEVKPGITGWAQVNGRNSLTWNEKFDLDIWYVDHCGVLLDMKICFMTLWKVICREGINQEGYETMETFKGEKNDVALGE